MFEIMRNKNIDINWRIELLEWYYKGMRFNVFVFDDKDYDYLNVENNIIKICSEYIKTNEYNKEYFGLLDRIFVTIDEYYISTILKLHDELIIQSKVNY
jgi:hypothetical protein